MTDGGAMKRLVHPFTKDVIRELATGDMVLISGRLLTGRDAVHKRLHEGEAPPVDLRDQIIYHCGPVVLERPDGSFEVKAAGPTTSMREEPYQWEVMRDHGIAGVIGKGGMGERTLEACREHGCAYFHAVGGAAQVLAETVVSVDGVHWRDLGSPEAIWELTVADFPALVTMDARGGSLHAQVEERSAAALKKVL